MSLCFTATGLGLGIVASSFTLSWTHTTERTIWQEDWRIEGDRLVLVEARVQGSGAGMEPPPEARLENGFYIWQPDLPPQTELILRRSEQAGDWRLCAGGRCASLTNWPGGNTDPVTLRPCLAPRLEEAKRNPE